MDQIILLIIALNQLNNVLLYLYLQTKNRRRWWVRNINQQMSQKGIYNMLFRELYTTDEEQFFEYTRMNPRQFYYLFSLVRPLLQKKKTREPLPARLRLIVTLTLVLANVMLSIL